MKRLAIAAAVFAYLGLLALITAALLTGGGSTTDKLAGAAYLWALLVGGPAGVAVIWMFDRDGPS